MPLYSEQKDGTPESDQDLQWRSTSVELGLQMKTSVALQRQLTCPLVGSLRWLVQPAIGLTHQLVTNEIAWELLSPERAGLVSSLWPHAGEVLQSCPCPGLMERGLASAMEEGPLTPQVGAGEAAITGYMVFMGAAWFVKNLCYMVLSDFMHSTFFFNWGLYFIFLF